jgi:hypothetical protein
MAQNLNTYRCSYAYDVPHYVDFTVQARTQKEAEKIIQLVLKADKFRNTAGIEDYAAWMNARVFVVKRVGADELLQPYLPTMAELLKETENETK